MQENFNENIREKINILIKEAGGLDLDPTLRHLITNICFMMYKAGMKDAFSLAEASIKVLKEENNH